MIPCLNPATTGGSESLEEFVAVAARCGFGGIEYEIAPVAEIIEQKSADAAKELFAAADVQHASFGLPVEFRKDEARFKEELPHLPRLAAAARQVGCTSCCTWLPPSTDEPLAEFTCRVVRLLSECAMAIADSGIRLAIEWVGPVIARTLKHDFIHTLRGDLELIGAINQPNVGLLFDSFHWSWHGHLAHDSSRGRRPCHKGAVRPFLFTPPLRLRAFALSSVSLLSLPPKYSPPESPTFSFLRTESRIVEV